MVATTHYEILGVASTASHQEIKKAWKQAARSTHPDLHKNDPTAEGRFKAASSAWDTLKDDTARSRYDAELLNPTQIPSPSPPRPRSRPRPQRARQANRDPDLCFDCDDVRLHHLLRCPHCETAWRRANASIPRGSMGMVVGYYSEQRTLETLYKGAGFGRDRARTRWIKPWALRGKKRRR